jgi:hypothetical protein
MRGRRKPFEAWSIGASKAAAQPLDDVAQQKLDRDETIASDLRFQQALDNAIQAKLEICSTSINTTPCTKSPIFVPGHDY